MGSSGRMRENVDAPHDLETVTNSRLSAYSLTVFGPLISWPTDEMA